MTWMQTFLGAAFNPLEPQVDQIHLPDIAHALSLTCRYGGHVRRFYSVAEHSVLLSETVQPRNALWALLHDATEAYVGDLIRPLKENLPAFVAIEDRLAEVIAERFQLSTPMPKEVQEHDLRIVIDESRQLLSTPPNPWPALIGLPPLWVTIEGWDPYRAEVEFLHRYSQLTDN